MKNKQEFENIYKKWYIGPRKDNTYKFSHLQKEYKEKYNNGMFRNIEHLTIEVIRQCNLNCQMCPISETKFINQNLEKMSFETYKNLVDNLPKTIKSITPNGIGEGFLHPDFLNILQYTKEKGFKVSVNSNGMFFDLESLNYLDEVIFSMDSVIQKELEEIRKNIDYDKLIDIIKKSKDYIVKHNLKTKLSINAVVSLTNKDNITQLFPFIDSLGVDTLSLSPASNYFSLNSDKFNLFEKNIIEKQALNWDEIVTNLIENDFSFESIIYYPNIRKGYCSFGFVQLFIDNDLNVCLCCIKPRDTIIGNLKNSTFDQIISSKLLQEYRDSQLNLTPYEVCDKCTVGMPCDTYRKMKGDL